MVITHQSTRRCYGDVDLLQLLRVVCVLVSKVTNKIKVKDSHALQKQECIPVGCVPPACWPYSTVSYVSVLHPGEGGRADTPPPWTEWQTCVKTLPCPKLRLQTVTMASRHLRLRHMLPRKWRRWLRQTNQLVGHLIIIKQPEHFPKFHGLDGPLKSMNKLTLKDPTITRSNPAWQRVPTEDLLYPTSTDT